ncbi:hypothetical protein [Neolewinella antarctica]|uniref:Outer membrane protein beta-barrel domain-containing protein n=1 Tax=Neolewinella antarctica TaxID=442734 RepID=A0ABX0XCC4_9BACT|nr:hypothetical protein [Neolewinella antarctica]NJC26735.1 hypothetical protein [Neolewinella antarctica]
MLDSIPAGTVVPAKIISVGQDYTNIPPPNAKSDLPVLRRLLRGSWKITGALGVTATNKFWGRANETFTHSTRLSEGGVRFFLPDGEVVFGDDRQGVRGSYTRHSAIYPRLGLARQLNWGGLLHGTLGYYQSTLKLNRDPFADLAENKLRTINTSEERLITLELGFQYTFLRTYRFRPFLGVALMNYLYYEGETRTNVYDGRSGQTNLFSGLRIKKSLSLNPELSLTAGFQYQLSERFSAGLFGHANWALEVFIEARLGLEMRYYFKRQRL